MGGGGVSSNLRDTKMFLYPSFTHKSFLNSRFSEPEAATQRWLKRSSDNMQQIYRKTPMPKCDFNEVALQLYWNHTSAWLFSWKLAAFFQNTFLEGTSGGGMLLQSLFVHFEALRNFLAFDLAFSLIIRILCFLLRLSCN